MILNLIVAVDSKTFGIGCKGGIPWKNKEDMQWFKKLTTGHACIMGWTTFISLGKVLPNRLNIVISPDQDATNYYNNDINNANVRNARGLEEAIKIAEDEKYEIGFVMGGGSIYGQYLEKDLVDTLYIDFIQNNEDFEFDTFFPFEKMHSSFNNIEHVNTSWEKYTIETTKTNNYVVYHRIRTDANNVDNAYLELLKNISKNGNIKHTRSGDTLSTFGNQIRFNVQKGLPLLTTKKVYSKGCIHELLWFLKGDTNIKYLVDNNTHIWDDDAYRYYLELIKKHNEIVILETEQDWPSYKRPQLTPVSKEEFIEKVKAGDKQHIVIDQKAYIMSFTPNCWSYDYTYGDLGPVYGKQWNDWASKNQLDDLIETLKTNPDDRRLLVSAWNVYDLDKMALPPCHYCYQLYTTELTYVERVKEWAKRTNSETASTDKELMINIMDNENIPTRKLSLMWNQRSVDVCLGLPYNILSYSILLHLIAQCVNMVPYEVIGNLGDTHIYKNQLDDMYFQMIRNPYKFDLPTIKINKDIANIHEFNYEDIVIENYKSYPTIKYKLSTGLQ